MVYATVKSPKISYNRIAIFEEIPEGKKCICALCKTEMLYNEILFDEIIINTYCSVACAKECGVFQLGEVPTTQKLIEKIPLKQEDLKPILEKLKKIRKICDKCGGKAKRGRNVFDHSENCCYARKA